MSDRTRAPGQGARLAGADCACVAEDAQRCAFLRADYLFDDECECTCHDDEEDDEEDWAHE
jgi:hypothetical protein